MAAPLYTTASGQLWHAGKILVVTVGLPARGKTHLSHALQRYLLWLGVKTSVQSLGDYRRQVLGSAENLPKDYFSHGERNPETELLRKKVLDGFDDQVMKFFNEGGQVVIYDANNGTQRRRKAVREKFEKVAHVMFLESIVTDESIVEANVRSVKISSPDYLKWDAEKAVQDFYERIRGHEKYYEPIENPSFPYVKVINVGQQIRVNNVSGYLQSRMVFFLMNIHNRNRTIYLARAGEALVEHLYKADADLSSLGYKYSERLKLAVENVRKMRRKEGEKRRGRVEGLPVSSPSIEDGKLMEKEKELIKDERAEEDENGAGPGEEGRALEVWTSSRRRSSHTALPFAASRYRVIERSQLAEMNPGVIDGMSVSEIKKRYPEEWEKKLKEPYSHRFPRAESYHDLSVRLEPIIFELERATSDVLIIGQSSVLRCLIAYLQGNKPHEIPAISIREGELLEISPQAYGVKTESHTFWNGVEERRLRDKEWEEMKLREREELEQRAEAQEEKINRDREVVI